MSEVDNLKKELDFYKKKFSLGENDVAVAGFLAYVNIVRQQVEYMKDFNIKANIEGKKSENAMYERTQAMWKELPEMISSVNRLKLELGIEYNPDEGKPKMTAVSPQSIAV
jgi:hypothetical protein